MNLTIMKTTNSMKLISDEEVDLSVTVDRTSDDLKLQDEVGGGGVQPISCLMPGHDMEGRCYLIIDCCFKGTLIILSKMSTSLKAIYKTNICCCIKG